MTLTGAVIEVFEQHLLPSRLRLSGKTLQNSARQCRSRLHPYTFVNVNPFMHFKPERQTKKNVGTEEFSAWEHVKEKHSDLI